MEQHPKNLAITDFAYNLPSEKIATYPLAERDASQLLVYKNGVIESATYKKIASFIPTKSFLVFNNTKVVEARLLFTKNTGAQIELFCLEPSATYGDITTAMLQQDIVQWKCLIGGAKKWKDDVLDKLITDASGTSYTLTAKKLQALPDCFLIELSWTKKCSFAEVLHDAGLIPLPPYLNRAAEEKDKATYQTIYAKEDGSVAAPTAGLHFTNNVFENFTAKQITNNYVTLHVGAGTFKPVKASTMEYHEMHSEYMDVSIEFITLLLQHVQQQQAPVIAVGTTSLRTIETLYWMGVKYLQAQAENKDIITIDTIAIEQWDAYQLPKQTAATTALQALLQFMKQQNLQRLLTKTQIIIAPPYTLKIAQAIVTNFHQPQSTLLLLVAAIVGKNWKTIYQYALENNYRFLSYGDGSLLWKE